MSDEEDFGDGLSIRPPQHAGSGGHRSEHRSRHHRGPPGQRREHRGPDQHRGRSRGDPRGDPRHQSRGSRHRRDDR